MLMNRLIFGCLVIFSLTQIGKADDEGWDFIVSFTAWDTDLGQSFQNSPTVERGVREIAFTPAFEVRNRNWNSLTLGVQYQIPANYKIQYAQQGGSSTQIDAERKDLDFYIGLSPEFSFWQTLTIIGVYKNLTYTEDDLNTTMIHDDYKIENAGFGLGLKDQWEFASHNNQKPRWRLYGMVYYAFLEATATQKEGPDIFYSRPFSYDLSGLWGEVRILYRLNNSWSDNTDKRTITWDLQLGYRQQRFAPSEQSVSVTRVWPDGSEHEVTRQPPEFRADGFSAGISILF